MTRAPRHPTANHPHNTDDTDLLSPHDYLARRENGNTRKNIQVANAAYERVMKNLAVKEGRGEVYPSLKEASVERLPHLIEKFLQTARRVNGEVYASGTLHTIWSGLAHILGTREVNPVDIKSNVCFQTAREMLARRANESAIAGRGPGVDAKNPVKPEHFLEAFTSGTIGMGNPRALLCMTHTAFVVGFGLRPGTECHMVTNSDLTYGPVDERYGRPAWIKLNERVTKTRKGRYNDKKELPSKVFPNDRNPEICLVRAIVAYRDKKSQKQMAPQANFFLNPNQIAQQNPAQTEHWWVGNGLVPGQQAGIHTLESLLTDALTAVGVDCKLEGYSAVSARKSMFQGGADGNVDSITLSRLGGQKSTISKRSYICSTDVHHKAASATIQERLFNNKAADYGSVVKEVEAESRGENVRQESSRKNSCSQSKFRGSKNRSSRSRSRRRSRSRDRRSSRDKRRRSRSSQRSRSRSRERSRSRKRRSRDRKRGSRSRRRSRSRSRERSRSRQRRSRSRDKRKRSRSRSRERSRSRQRRSRQRRSRSRDKRSSSRERSRERGRSRSRDKRSSKSRRRSRSRDNRRRSRSSQRSRSRTRERSRSRQRRSSSRDKRSSRPRRRSKSRSRNKRRSGDKRSRSGSGQRMSRERSRPDRNESKSLGDVVSQHEEDSAISEVKGQISR